MPVVAVGSAGGRTPTTPGYRRRRTNFEVNIEEILTSVRNGMRVPNILSSDVLREQRYQAWLLRAGMGTRPEFMCFEALERRGLLAPQSQPPGLDFQFQVPLGGGRGKVGGAVADFVVWAVAPFVVIRVQGEYWHFGNDDVRAADILERAMLESDGFRVVDILAQDLLDETRADEVVGLALLGMQLDFAGRLQVY